MMRGEVSTKNKYYIPKFRRLELKNFCLQYPDWEREYRELAEVTLPSNRYGSYRHTTVKTDPVMRKAIRRQELFEKIKLVNETAILSDEALAKYILLSVTHGYSYDYFYSRLEIPCGRDMFYDRVRKFYWLLDKK